MAKIAVIVLHGIGTYHADFQFEHRRFDRRLREGLANRLGARMDDLLWVPVLWSDKVLEDRQAKLLRERKPPRPWRRLFAFIAANLGDATAYTLPRSESGYHGCSYFIIQNHVRTALERAETALGGAEAASNVPVLAIAHSMGCHVLSSYAWDANHAARRVLRAEEGDDESGLTDFQRLRTLAGLAFTGCNLPLLTMNVPRDAMLPMKLPKQPIPGSAFGSRWLNFYERDDALGYPLKKEYESYFDGDHPAPDRLRIWGRDPAAETRPEDVEVKRRTVWGMTPYAHQLYERMPAVLDPIAREIERLLDAVS